MPHSIPEIKRCPKCGIEYPRTAEFWHRHKSAADGLRSRCKHCHREDSRVWAKANPEKLRIMNQAWKQANPERSRAIKKAWANANPEKCRANVKAWALANPERKRATTKAWQAAHPENRRASAQKWARQHLDYFRAYVQRRRAMKRNLPDTLTPTEWESILADYGYQCAYCDKTWLDCKLTQDHVIPVARGGGYTADNIVPACKSCNSRKKNRTPEQAGMTLRTTD